MKPVVQYFLDYVKHDTQSDLTSQNRPSTMTQTKFSNYLYGECQRIGLSEIKQHSDSTITAVLPSNIEGSRPVIGFIAHMDTSPDASGTNVKPVLTENYNGKPIPLQGITLSPKEFPQLLLYEGETIITSDGTTLLGADDKAGIAEIICAMEYLVQHPKIRHGKIVIAFTPDEEIGRGVDCFDVEEFGADFAYTIDGGRVGELEYENFNAARADITIKGKSVHPGTAKDSMCNAALIGAELANCFPLTETPAHTEQYEGFYHLCSFHGTVEAAQLSYIIRDFDMTDFEKRKTFVKELVSNFNIKYENCITLDMHDEYYNMAAKIEEHAQIVELAAKAMEDCGITPMIQPIRGGTDGARLSYMGLPCPNLFAGGHNFHGPYEFIPVSSMEKATAVIIRLCELTAL